MTIDGALLTNGPTRSSTGAIAMTPQSLKSVSIPVSPGELLDKISILTIKRERITDAAKLANIERNWRSLWTCEMRVCRILRNWPS